jgi:hypothetical protein
LGCGNPKTYILPNQSLDAAKTFRRKKVMSSHRSLWGMKDG